MLSQMNDDIIQCIILSINTVDDIKNLYLTNRQFNKSLDNPYIISLLTIKFNVTDIYKKFLFKYFIKHCGHLFVPHYIRYKKECYNQTYFTQYNGYQPYKVNIY